MGEGSFKTRGQKGNAAANSSIDEDGMKQFKKQVFDEIKSESNAILKIAQEIKQKTYKAPLNLFYEHTYGIPSAS
jgi:hypothetical protein